MKKLELKSRKLLRTIFGGLSLTAVAFIFQACYGMPPNPGYSIKVSGIVKSKTTHLPIKGIKVAQLNDPSYAITDEKGNFSFYTYINEDRYMYNNDSTYRSDSIPILFLDIDSIENGYFVDKTIIVNPAHKDEVKINVEMKEK